MFKIGDWINIIDTVWVWGVAFYLLKPEGVKRLWPIAVLGVIVILVGEQILMYLNYIMFPMGLFKVLNTPLFHYGWASGSALIVMHFMPEEWSKKLPLILIFSAAIVGFAFMASKLGNFALINGFNFIYDFIFNFIWLTVFVWLSEKVFGHLLTEVYQKV